MYKTLCWVLEPAQSVLVLPEPGRREFSVKAGGQQKTKPSLGEPGEVMFNLGPEE